MLDMEGLENWEAAAVVCIMNKSLRYTRVCILHMSAHVYCPNGFSISARSRQLQTSSFLVVKGNTPADPSVGLMSTTLGPLSTTSPNVLEGMALSTRRVSQYKRRNKSHAASIGFSEGLTFVLLDNVVHHQVHELVKALEDARDCRGGSCQLELLCNSAF